MASQSQEARFEKQPQLRRARGTCLVPAEGLWERAAVLRCSGVNGAGKSAQGTRQLWGAASVLPRLQPHREGFQGLALPGKKVV